MPFPNDLFRGQLGKTVDVRIGAEMHVARAGPLLFQRIGTKSLPALTPMMTGRNDFFDFELGRLIGHTGLVVPVRALSP
jgi:hypothetical protein